MRTLFILFGLWTCLAANAQTVSEHDMKAAYLYNFAYLFEWPESRRANFHICILGDEEVGAAMLDYDAKRVNGQRMVIARLTTLAPIRLCDILYVGAAEVVNLPKIRTILGSLPTLTVTDKAPLQSVSVALTLENKYLTFDVNLEQCDRANLKPRQTVLGLARNVHKSPENDTRRSPASR